METGNRKLRQELTALKQELLFFKKIIERLPKIEGELVVSENRFRKIFDNSPVSIREENCSRLIETIEKLKKQGIKDFRTYCRENPGFVKKAQGMIKIVRVNDATLSLYGAKDREELFGSLDRTLLKESLPVFVEEIVALAEGKLSFEGENINRTLQGEKINVLVKIIYPLEEGKIRTALVSTMDITRLKQTEAALRDQMEANRLILETTTSGLLITDSAEQIIEANPAATDMLGWNRGELIGMGLDQVDCSRLHRPKIRKETEFTEGKRYETAYQTKNGNCLDVEVHRNTFKVGRQTIAFYFFSDISARKQTELALREREKELAIKSANLEEANAALRHLLRQREQDKTKLEQNLLTNVETLVIPYLEKLRQTGLSPQQASLLEVARSNLSDLTAPLSNHLPLESLKLTPSELEVANLIKQGRTTKEIAEIFSVSARTIETHRRNIRKKVGLRNVKVNLRTHLYTK